MNLTNLTSQIYYKPLAIVPEHYHSVNNLLTNLPQSLDLEDLLDEVKPVYQPMGNVDVINISGLLLPKVSKLEAAIFGATGYNDIRQAIRQAELSPSKHVIFNICSGGGSVKGMKETAKMIKRLAASKNVMAYSDDICASAAYYLANAAGRIYGSESAEFGSVGCFIAMITEEKNLVENGFNPELIKAGKWKALGISIKDLSDEERQLLQDSVDAYYQDFKNFLSFRNIADENLQGQSFETLEAVNINMVDGVVDTLDGLISVYSFSSQNNPFIP